MQLARSFFSGALLEHLQLPGTLLTMLWCQDPSFTATDRRSSAIIAHRIRNELALIPFGREYCKFEESERIIELTMAPCFLSMSTIRDAMLQDAVSSVDL